MKQKVVISFSYNCNRNSQSNALQIAAGFSGVESVALEGEDKTQIVVTGVNIDIIGLLKKLNKKVGFSHILTVTIIDGDNRDNVEDEDAAAEEGNEKPQVCPNYQVNLPPPYYFCEVPAYPPNNCTLL